MSWPTMMWPFSSRSTRWASTPNGRMPCGLPGLHQRVPERLAELRGHVDLVAELADEADAHAAAPGRRPPCRRARRGRGSLGERSMSVQARCSTSRDRGPAMLTPAIGGGDVGDVDIEPPLAFHAASRGRRRRRRRWWR